MARAEGFLALARDDAGRGVKLRGSEGAGQSQGDQAAGATFTVTAVVLGLGTRHA